MKIKKITGRQAAAEAEAEAKAPVAVAVAALAALAPTTKAATRCQSTPTSTAAPGSVFATEFADNAEGKRGREKEKERGVRAREG